MPPTVCSKRLCQSGRDVRRDFNSGTMNFYLLNFLLSPSPQLRAAVDATVRAVRAPGPDCAAPQSFAIGIHMRWVAVGAQYLFEPQFGVFVAAAAALARGNPSTSRVMTRSTLSGCRSSCIDLRWDGACSLRP